MTVFRVVSKFSLAAPTVKIQTFVRRSHAVLFVLQVAGGQGRGGRAEERAEHLRHAALGRPVPEHQADGHQRGGRGGRWERRRGRSRRVPPHGGGAQLFHPRLGRQVRAAAGRRGRHPSPAGRGQKGSRLRAVIVLPQ